MIPRGPQALLVTVACCQGQEKREREGGGEGGRRQRGRRSDLDCKLTIAVQISLGPVFKSEILLPSTREHFANHSFFQKFRRQISQKSVRVLNDF